MSLDFCKFRGTDDIYRIEIDGLIIGGKRCAKKKH